MRRERFLRVLVFVLVCAWIVLLTGCGGILEISLDQTPTPASGTEATVAALETQVATLLPGQFALDASADSETIRQRMLESHARWKSAWVDGVITQYAGEEPASMMRIQIWADQETARLRLLSGAVEGAPDFLQVSDGQTLSTMRLPGRERQDQPVQPDARAPFQAPAAVSNGVVQHPLSGLLQTPANQALFPTSLAQRGGDYRPVGMDEVAGRPALEVEWYQDSQRWDRFWLDARTGILLRWQNFSKGTPGLAMEVVFNRVEFEPVLPDELFSTRISQAPQFALDSSGKPALMPQPPSAVFEPGKSELYFVVNGLGTGGQLALMHMPAACVTAGSPCPQPEAVPGYPNVDGYIEALVWAPDGSSAAVIIYDNARGKAVLWRYTPGEEKWGTLAEFTILSSPVIWSPDGQWLAFKAQSSGAAEDMWAVRVDGSDLQNLTQGQFVPSGSYVSPLAWLDNERVSFWMLNGRAAEVFVFQRGGKLAEKLNEFVLINGNGAFSPDRQTLAFSYQEEQEGAVLSLAGQDGSGSRRIASFQQTSFQQILWTPDGGWIVFRTLTGSALNSNLITMVYAIRQDGTDLRQLYQAANVTNMLVSSDSRFVVIEDADTNRLASVSIEGGPARPLEIPGLRLDEPVSGASWRN